MTMMRSFNSQFLFLSVFFLSLFFTAFAFAAKEADKQVGWKSINADYYSYITTATNTQPGTDNSAAAGIFRLFGNYVLGDSQNDYGKVVFKVEHRDSYTTTSPKYFVLNNVGAIGLIEPQFNDQGFRLTNLYWQKQWNNNNIEVLAGFLDTTDYVDTYMLGNPWSGFANFIFSTGAGSLAIPDEATLGIALRNMFTSNLYGLGSLTDANASSSEPFDGLFQGSELFSSLELGWVESLDSFYTRNLHLTYWRLDGGTRHSIEDSSGYNFSLIYKVDDWIPFIRAGYAEGDASLLSSSITMGLGYLGVGDGSDSINFAMGWGQPNKAIFGIQFEDQYTAEVFYKTSIGKHVTLSPNIQYLKTLPLSSDYDDSWVFGLRMHLKI